MFESEKEYSGEWFLPKSPNIRLPGVLKVGQEEDEVILVLFAEKNIDGSEIDHHAPISEMVSSKLVLGNVLDVAREISLFHYSDAPQIFITQHVYGKQYKIIFNCSHVLLGKHFYNEDEIAFKRLNFEFEGVKNWFSNSFRNHHRVEGEPHERNIKYDLPPRQLLYTSREYTIYYEPWVGVSGQNNELKSHVINDISIEFNTLGGLTQCYNIVVMISEFFKLALCQDIKWVNENAVDDKQQDIEIYNSRLDKKQVPWKNPKRFLIKMDDFENTQILFENWFACYSSFQFSLELFLHGVIPHWKRGSKTFYFTDYSNHFLNVVRGIETFVKKKNGYDYSLDIKEYQSRKSKIIEVLDKSNLSLEDKSFVKKNIPKKYINPDKGGFKELLMGTFSSFKVCLEEIIKPEFFEKHVNKIVDCRDDLAHVNHATSEEFSEKYDLYNLFSLCQLLYLAMICREIGFNDIQIKEALNRIDVV
jgi:hypothetical protein